MYEKILRVDALTEIRNYYAGCTSTLTLSTTGADVPGCSITFTTKRAGALYFVVATFDFGWGTLAAGNVAIGSIVVDGAVTGGQALLDGGLARGTPAQNLTGVLPAAGSHTIKLQASKFSASGVASANSLHTSLSILVLEPGA